MTPATTRAPITGTPARDAINPSGDRGRCKLLETTSIFYNKSLGNTKLEFISNMPD